MPVGGGTWEEIRGYERYNVTENGGGKKVVETRLRQGCKVEEV